MRILRPAVLAAAAGVALLCGAVPAQANGSTAEGLPSVRVSPDFAEPGETIGVTATCRQTSATRTVVTSGAFDPVTLDLPAGASQPTVADTVVINNVRPGKFTVSSTCDDNSTSSTTLTILAKGAPHLVPEVGAHTGGGSAPPMVPEGGAHTGGGSTAPNRPPSAAVGAALLGSGVGLVAFALRRRFARR
jgi:hypothetical protein